MSHLTRFGRKLALPSTRQIIHEYLVYSALEDARKLKAADAPVVEHHEAGVAVGSTASQAVTP